MKALTLGMALATLTAAAAAQAEPGVSFTFGAGTSLAPAYFGSDDYEFGPTGTVRLHGLQIGQFSFGSPDPSVERMGWGLRGAFRYLRSREAADHPELTGLADIDAAIELGLGIGYEAERYRAFADLRYGVIGHESFVAELGADAKLRASDRLTLTAGPRLLIGSDRYAATYFGVTPVESVASGLPAFAAEGGLLTAGVQVGMAYDLGGDWGLEGTVGYAWLQGDAADSPITAMGSRTQGTASLMLTRRFTLGY